MEPFAARAAAAVIRPASASTSEASTILRNGRILAAEVLSAPNDGTLLLALGRHRVPAETNIQLDPGQTFLVRVDGEGDEVVLRIVRPGDPAVAQLLEALRRVVGEERPIGELLQLMAARVAAEAEAPGGALEELRNLQRLLPAHAMDPKGGAAGLLELLGRAGVRYEALLVAAARGRATPEVLERLRSNLKAELLRAFARLEDGPVRELVGRVLSGLEAEQLLNVARRNAGEPLVWSFPFPDTDGWTTAYLVHSRRDDGGRGGASAGGDDDQGAEHLTVGVKFSRLGAIRVDLSLTRDVLYVRLYVAREDLVTRIQADFGDLLARLGDGRRAVNLFARVASEDEVAVESHPLDIRFLRDHHLMDIDG